MEEVDIIYMKDVTEVRLISWLRDNEKTDVTKL